MVRYAPIFCLFCWKEALSVRSDHCRAMGYRIRGVTVVLGMGSATGGGDASPPTKKLGGDIMSHVPPPQSRWFSSNRNYPSSDASSSFQCMRVSCRPYSSFISQRTFLNFIFYPLGLGHSNIHTKISKKMCSFFTFIPLYSEKGMTTFF